MVSTPRGAPGSQLFGDVDGGHHTVLGLRFMGDPRPGDAEGAVVAVELVGGVLAGPVAGPVVVGGRASVHAQRAIGGQRRQYARGGGELDEIVAAS